MMHEKLDDTAQFVRLAGNSYALSTIVLMISGIFILKDPTVGLLVT